MRRWLAVLILRRRRDYLEERVDWIRQMLWSGQSSLESTEQQLRAVQARLWAAESPRSLISGRADPGISQRG